MPLMPTPRAGFDDYGGRCLSVVQLGTENLARAIQQRWGGKSLGIYNCRPPSLHSEGRAYDHAWRTKATGFDIARRLVSLHAELGIQTVIWWRKIWSVTYADEGWRDYDGVSPHTDHLHIAQNWSGARYLTYEAARRLLGVGQPAPPLPPPPPKESDDMFVVIGYKGGPALWYFYPAIGKKAPIPDQEALEEAMKGDAFGGFNRQTQSTIDRVPEL